MKRILFWLVAFSFLVAASNSAAVDATAIDAVRKKGVLTNQDLRVIDDFLADAVRRRGAGRRDNYPPPRQRPSSQRPF